MVVRSVALTCALLTVVSGVPNGALAAPGDRLAAERTRLGADRGLTPLKPSDVDPTRFVTGPPQPADAVPGGRDGFAITLMVRGDVVTSELLDVMTPGRAYDIAADGHALAVRAFSAPIANDFAHSTLVAKQQQDPDIVQTFRRGARFAYRTVDDRRNAMHSLEVLPLGSLAASMHDYGVVLAAPAVQPDRVFVVSANGQLAPVAQRVRGAFRVLPDGSAPGPQVHVIFGDRVVATVPTFVTDGQTHVTVPAGMPLDGRTNALASPTLGGHARQARRAPTAAERRSVLALAAARLHASAAALEVRALSALDLGRGMAIAGTVNLRGTSTPRVDHRLFFVAESAHGAWALTLAGMQTITVTEPLLEEPAEYLIDALDLDAGTVALVTRIVGYDAAAYAIYTRTGTGWKPVFSGGGAAN